MLVKASTCARTSGDEIEPRDSLIDLPLVFSLSRARARARSFRFLKTPLRSAFRRWSPPLPVGGVKKSAKEGVSSRPLKKRSMHRRL